MRNKKIFMYLTIIILIIIILIIGYLIYKKNNNGNLKYNEYIPEEEITDEQLRTTIITLYFLDDKTSTIQPEARQIDVKELLDNAPQKLINLLIEGPKSDNLIKLIPDNTRVNNVEIIGDVLYLDLSDDFIKEQNLGQEKEELIIKSIVNTVTQLNEINSVKILINGESNMEFPDKGLSLEKEFKIE